MNKLNQVEIFDTIRRACCKAYEKFTINHIATETGLRYEVVANKIEILELLTIVEKKGKTYSYVGLTKDIFNDYFYYKNKYDRIKEVTDES